MDEDLKPGQKLVLALIWGWPIQGTGSQTGTRTKTGTEARAYTYISLMLLVFDGQRVFFAVNCTQTITELTSKTEKTWRRWIMIIFYLWKFSIFFVLFCIFLYFVVLSEKIGRHEYKKYKKHAYSPTRAKCLWCPKNTKCLHDLFE